MYYFELNEFSPSLPSFCHIFLRLLEVPAVTLSSDLYNYRFYLINYDNKIIVNQFVLIIQSAYYNICFAEILLWFCIFVSIYYILTVTLSSIFMLVCVCKSYRWATYMWVMIVLYGLSLGMFFILVCSDGTNNRLSLIILHYHKYHVKHSDILGSKKCYTNKDDDDDDYYN